MTCNNKMTSFSLWKSAEITLLKNSLKSATRNSKISLRTIDVFSSTVHPTSAACVCKWALNCVLSKNLKVFPEKSCEKTCESLCGPRQKLRVRTNSSSGPYDVFSTALHSTYAACVYKRTWNCALSTNSKSFLKNAKKITNLLLKPRSIYAGSGDIVFTR